MNRKSPARVLSALALAAGVVLTTAATTGAAPAPADDRGRIEQAGEAAQAQPDATNALRCPGRNTADGTAAAVAPEEPIDPAPPPTSPGPLPDPRVTNPGPGDGDPCPPDDPAPDPDSGPDGNPPAGPASPPDDPAPVGDPPASPASPPAERTGPQTAAAPTASLGTLAAALQTTMNGVTARVFAPPGLGVGPVEITVLFGDRLLTAEYNNGSGTLLKHHFEHRYGTVRTENLDITLRERGPDGPRMYSITTTVTVEPQFDITFSGLTVDIDGRCDVIGSPEATIYWVDADGVQHRYDENSDFLAPGLTFGVQEFEFSARRASPARALTLPTFTWYERDPGGSIGEPGLPRGPQVLPRPDGPAGLVDTELPVRVAGLAEGDGDDCTAAFSYTIRYHPVLG